MIIPFRRYGSGSAAILAAGLLLAPTSAPASIPSLRAPSPPIHQEVPVHRPGPGGGATDDPLDELTAEVLATHPEVEAALREVEAARARIPQAGVLPDPMVSAGLMNLPLSDPSLSAEGMTMLSFRLEQRLPPAGLRAARGAAAEAEAAVALARVDVVRWAVSTRLKEAYFELLLVEEALAVHHSIHSSLEAIAGSAEAAFSQGLAPGADVLRAHTELAAIHEHLSELRQRRTAALAEVNSLLGRETTEPLVPHVPRRIAALLEGEPDPGFLAASVLGGELGPGFPSLRDLEEVALRNRPELAMSRHGAEALRHRETAAIRERRPGISLMGEYGARSGRSDMVSIGVAIELPVFRSRKQDQAVVEARAEHRVRELGTETTARDIRSEVAAAHADLVRTRERILLLDDAVLPQSRATLESRMALYRTGRGDFTGLMQAQALLFRSEIERAHLTAALGQALAALERAVGSELTIKEER